MHVLGRYISGSALCTRLSRLELPDGIPLGLGLVVLYLVNFHVLFIKCVVTLLL